MRKYQKEHILRLIKTLKDANSELTRLHADNHSDRCIGLLADCQEGALQIGQTIESIVGEENATVSLLEEYCDILYFASVEIDRGGEIPPFIARLQNQLAAIENSVNDELKQTKIEIAFFPYKASMWDSCESVWMAAKDDPRCDVYVVPIPYFDRMPPDGKPGQMHDEADQFPDYVPIVSWREYNLEERRPDIAVTINPYDDRNMVTIVHPNFFNARLKKFADQLVYIPYFVCLEEVASSFCKCPGVLYADRVFVQSDPIRDTYLRVLKKMEQENQSVGRFGPLEEKIVALGSPKFDKVVNTRRENCPIPDDWRQCMEKPDGTRRRVILYNTSISSLLKGNGKVLRKLRNVIEYFRKRDDLTLLWRPHPLNQSTYQTMRPNLMKEYQEILEQYRRERIGIYDDTADLHRAIAISDAYYGDGGSLVPLYACTGKPILLQMIQQSPLTAGKVLASHIHDDGPYWWCSAYDCNALFRVDKKTMISEFMGSFPEENTQYLYVDVHEQGGKLYFPPFNADQMAVYDKKRHTFERISFQQQEKLDWLRPGPNRYFTKVVPYQRFLFLVGNAYPAIVRYDMESGEMVYCTDWVHHLEQAARQSPHWMKWNETNDFNALLRPGREVIGSEIVGNVFVSNELMFFDMETLTHQFYQIGEQNERYYGVCYDGEHYWLASRQGNYIVKWKRDTQSVEKFELPNYVEMGHAINFQAIIYARGYVWLIPYEASTALKVDIRNSSIHLANEFDLPETGESLTYMNVKQTDETVYALTNSHVLQWDMKQELFHFYELPLSDHGADAVMELRLAALRKQPDEVKNVMDTIHMEARVSLDSFLHVVAHLDTVPFAQAQSDLQIQLCGELANGRIGSSGRAIHELIMQSLHASGGQ